MSFQSKSRALFELHPEHREDEMMEVPVLIGSPPHSEISVIIPVHNGGMMFRQCLSSLTKTVPPPHEIIVVADGDTDGSLLIAEELGAKGLRLGKRGGPARARNYGAKAAQGEILFFVDADVVIPKDAIGRIEAAFRDDPKLDALFGSYDDKPGENNFLSQYKNLFHHYVHQMGNEEASTFWGACGAVRREIFIKLGGFNESYRQPSIEDIELGYRLKQAGCRIKLYKTLQVTHLKYWGAISLLKSDFFYRALPWTELILRDRFFINDLNLRVSNRISVMLVFCIGLALMGTWWSFASFGIVLFLGPLLFVLNASLYRFFLRKRGPGFAIRTIPWHWFYCFYSGLAFALGLGRHLFSRMRIGSLRGDHKPFISTPLQP